MTKMVKVLVLVSMLTVVLPISPAQACACGPDWSMMTPQQEASFIDGLDAQTRISDWQNGLLPPAPPGYKYDATYKLVPL
jgi:hypothetical protein